MKRKPVEILITNDDGYASKGINFLTEIMSSYGNVTVIAPKEVQSGMSAALSIGKPMRLERISSKVCENGHRVIVYALSGTPVDCVKMAMNKCFSAGGSESVIQDEWAEERGYRPDIILSGINHGSNASVASMYSGTLGAAAEGALYGIKSVGLSINTHNPDPDFMQVKEYLVSILEKAMGSTTVEGIYLNVNFPAIEKGKIKGIRMAKQGSGVWVKEFEQRKDPNGKDYYWMTGNFKNTETDEKTIGDHILMDNGYITIVPHKVDTTSYETLEQMKKDWKL